VTEDACRIDVWLWQSRAPLDKPSRPVRCGDVLSFAQGSRWVAVKVEALGERRGPAPEARALYSALTDPGATGADVAPKAAGRAVEGCDFNRMRD
jgi:ribosome-associated heat shock protein Hsp15